MSLCCCSFAFVEFSNSASVDAVLRQNEEWQMDGRTLRLDRAGGGSFGGGGGFGGSGDAGRSRFQSKTGILFTEVLHCLNFDSCALSTDFVVALTLQSFHNFKRENNNKLTQEKKRNNEVVNYYKNLSKA